MKVLFKYQNRLKIQIKFKNKNSIDCSIREVFKQFAPFIINQTVK